MALIFPRIAKNFIKNGYFPTDLPTLDRIASALDVATSGPVRVLDPCCGEGAALQHIAGHLQSCGGDVASFGIDVDEERAWHAKTVLGTVAHADVHDVRLSDRSMGLLFLNPPNRSTDDALSPTSFPSLRRPPGSPGHAPRCRWLQPARRSTPATGAACPSTASSRCARACAASSWKGAGACWIAPGR